ncbi:ankyrin repeat domain-containing protein [Aliiroseovarius sp. S253]|uniref:ankyrin repeat domain-containing protein n=1 Tax=Aliiroseovarius sp. S253 TaxID=3415133 RepID=UPI003C7AEEB7
MATLPNSESALLTLSQLIAPLDWQKQTLIKKRFKAGEMPFANQQQKVEEILTSLSNALGLTEQDKIWWEILNQIAHHLQYFDALAANTRSFQANEQHILWQCLAYDILPGLGRTWGFWSLDVPFMPEMSGGDVWFLPKIDPNDPERLILPVQTVAQWWRDLLGGRISHTWPKAENERLRSFQNWASGDTTPAIEKLHACFPDKAEFNYVGTFTLPEDPNDSFEAARGFLRDIKALDPEGIAATCPQLPLELASRALAGTASPDEQKAFVDAVCRRWAQPSDRTVRTMFLAARGLEQGFKDLVSILTPGVDPHDADPMRNKTLQLVELFRLAWEHTAKTGTTDPIASDKAFCASVPSWLASGPFEGIMPGRNGPPAPEKLAKRMTERFMRTTPDANLPDLFADSTLTLPASPKGDETIAEERARMLAKVEEAFALQRSSGKDRAHRMAKAITDLRLMPRAAEIEADILHLEALDHINHGSFDEAEKLLDRALTLSTDTSFGERRLLIARHAFAFSAGRMAFDKGFERHFRIFVRSLTEEEVHRWEVGFAPITHSLRLAARDMSEYFWTNLLRPYHGVQIDHPLQASSEMMREYVQLARHGAEGKSVKEFLKSHKRELRRKLRDVRGDTFFGMMLKATPDIVDLFQRTGAQYGLAGMPSGAARPGRLAKNVRATFLSLAKTLPSDFLTIKDYRNQSPLILAADQGDVDLVRILLSKLVDPDVQDTLGRTALHAAAKKGNTQCFQMILKKGADPNRRTCEGRTPALIATQFGSVEIFGLCLKNDRAFEGEDLTAAYEMAKRCFTDYAHFRDTYEEAGQRVGTREDYQAIMEMAERALLASKTTNSSRTHV